MRGRLGAPRGAVRDVEEAHRREAARPVEVGEPEPVLVRLRERAAAALGHPRRVGQLGRPPRIPLEVLVDRNDLGHGLPPCVLVVVSPAFGRMASYCVTRAVTR